MVHQAIHKNRGGNMIDIICDKCKAKASLDSKLTTKDYIDNMETLVIENGELTESRPSHFYYKCIQCNTSYKLTIEELLPKIRDVFVKEALAIRYEGAFKSFRKHKIEEDSGITYCGQCPGLDGVGNCFKDAYNICSMRRI